MVVVSYGALAPAHGRSRTVGMVVRTRAAAAMLGMVAAVALVSLSVRGTDRKTELFFMRFPRAPTSQLVSWDGCGAGGDCGGRYHWTAHSFSPVQGRQIDMKFTHDHNSIANWWNRTAFEMGLPGPHWVKGAHRAYDFSNGTYGYGGAYRGLTPSYNELPEFNATWEPELIDPLEYWAQFFPIEKGYSSNLFGEEGEEEEEEEEEEAEEEEEEEAAEPPPPPHLFGRENQMIFADLDPINNVEPITVINGPSYHRVTPGSWYVFSQPLLVWTHLRVFWLHSHAHPCSRVLNLPFNLGTFESFGGAKIHMLSCQVLSCTCSCLCGALKPAYLGTAGTGVQGIGVYMV